MTDILNLYLGNRDSGKTKLLVSKLLESLAHNPGKSPDKFVFISIQRDKEFLANNPDLIPLRNKFTYIQISDINYPEPQLDRKLTSKRPHFLFLDEFDLYGNNALDVILYICNHQKMEQIYVATSPYRFRRFEEIKQALHNQYSNKDLLIEFLLISDWEHGYLFNPDTAEIYLKQKLRPQTILTEGFGLYTELTNLKI